MRPLVGTVVLIGMLFLAVVPTRTYLAQRRQLTATERRVAALSRQNAELTARAERLNTDAEIERLARERHNLVRPGEEAFAILPPPGPPQPDQPAEEDRARPGLWSRIWDTLTFWS